MKKVTSNALLISFFLIGFLSSCHHDDPCKNNLFISSIIPTVAFTGQNIGTANISVTGDTAGIMYRLNSGAYQSNPEFLSLEPGKYTAEVKNTKNCSNSLDFEIPASDPCVVIPIVVATTKTNPLTVSNNGTITATAAGGNGFTYSINNGSPLPNGNSTFTSLGPGTYTITVKNSYGCTKTAEVVLTAVDPCTVMTVQVSATKVDPTNNLANGSITASAVNDPGNLGGTPFTYRINNNAFTANNVFTNLPVGSYTVTARNSFGCTSSAFTINLVNTPNCGTKVINVTGTPTNVVPCQPIANNGSITASAQTTSGPSALPFSYSMSMNGTYTPSATFNNLAVGSYIIYAKDADGCIKASAPIAVGMAAAGTNYRIVQTIISTKCSIAGCHVSGASIGDFTSDCKILPYGARIYTRTILSSGPSLMPPLSRPQLTPAEITAIKNWNTAGLKYTD